MDNLVCFDIDLAHWDSNIALVKINDDIVLQIGATVRIQRINITGFGPLTEKDFIGNWIVEAVAPDRRTAIARRKNSIE